MCVCACVCRDQEQFGGEIIPCEAASSCLINITGKNNMPPALGRGGGRGHPQYFTPHNGVLKLKKA